MNPAGHSLDAVKWAVSETFENFAFLEPIYISDAYSQLPADGTVYSIEITAPLQARLLMVLEDDLVKETTMSVWAVTRESLSPQMIDDTLAEIVNTVAGRYMNLLVSKDETFKIGIPEKSDLIVKENDYKLFCNFSINGKLLHTIII